MKDFLARIGILLFFFTSLNSIRSNGQQPTTANNGGLRIGLPNYTTFSAPAIEITDEVIAANKGYEQHPELGMLYAGAPCSNCYELIGSRTENSKTFIKAGTDGKDIMKQTASGSLHYKGINGEWLTIRSRLAPGPLHGGVFSAMEQEAPVTINTTDKYCALGAAGKQIEFNRNLELIYAKPDGTEQAIGEADYSHYTAGDDGMYITNAWPGIDIEMHVVRGAIKTNFLINHALPAYAGGRLLIRDHMHLENGLFLNVQDENKSRHMGGMSITRGNGANLYEISAAVAFEQAEGRGSLRLLAYLVKGTDVDIEVPGNFLDRPAKAYPVVIDPLVSFASSSTIAGSKYSPSWTTGCSYPNTGAVPAQVTVTDVQFTFQYIASGGALTNNGAYDFKLGTCRSPAPTSLFWNCSSGLPGTCDAVGATIFLGQIAPCIPAPQCAAYDLNLTMDFYQNYASVSGCSPTYIAAGTPLTITVFGHTVESNAIVASASSICQGQSATLTASSVYGVPPYTYSWAPGSGTGTSITVSPASTTTYTVTSTDACGNMSTAIKTITVNPVSPITGTTTICSGGSTTLSGTPSGGTWASSTPSIASVGSSSGVVTGSALGAAIITYVTPAGCSSTTTVNVIVPVSSIGGYMVVCQGSTTTLSNSTPGGLWSSGNTSIATVGSASGVASGVSGGLATISYTTSGAGCYATAILTVNPVAPITGSVTICVGSVTTLSNAVTGGAWSSGNPAIATIGSSTGTVTGISAGTVIITYVTPAGCVVTTSVVVNLLSPITGTTSICQGSTTTLSDLASSGVWSSSNTAVATIGSASGIVSGLSAGTTVITYTVPGGCFATTVVTVNLIAPITGTTTACVGGTTTLSDPAGPGTWVSSNTGVATIGSSTGIVTGVTVGSANITYTSAAGCVAITTVNVGLPTPITGVTVVCEGSTTALSNSTPGGSWSSAGTAIATVGASSGIVTGTGGGTVAISYTTPSGCVVTATVTVNPDPPITGTTMICVGSTSLLSNAAAGGTWSSATPGVASIGPTTGLMSGLSVGTSVISYVTPAGCVSTTTVSVNVPAPITGVTTICQGAATTLSNATPGGIWASSNPSVATVGSSTGAVSGVAGGTVTINYTTSGGCNATTTLTVNPIAPVTGVASLCTGNTATFTDATPGGTWSSSSPGIASVSSSAGVVTGVSAGTATISYTTAAGCIATANILINPSPSPIAGSTLVCTTTTLTNLVGGGIWSSSNPSIATIAPSGLVTGIGPGVVVITYTLPGGCATTTTLTVNPLANISGVTSICQGTSTLFSYPQPGGTWTSLNPAVATVDPVSGLVTGVSPGSATIKYTTSTGCVASINVTIFAALPITGTTVLCQGSTTTLSNAVAGGTFSSSNPGVATVGVSSGVVTGVAGGTAVISYTTSAGCITTVTVTVNPLLAITGASSICAGNTTTLSDAVPGGTWSSLAPSVASVDVVTGLVTGMSAGTTTIKYTTPEGCVAVRLFTVNPVPGVIAGTLIVCQGYTTALSNSLPGGIWISSLPGIAAVVPTTGVVTGVAAGTATISYTTAAGCFVTADVTVNPLSPITGVSSICAGATTTLSDATPGGTWTSTLTSIATIDPVTGLVTGIGGGTTTIKYTTSLGCVANFTETINPLPSAIGGVAKVCVGSTTVLTNTLSGGTWSTYDPAVATAGASTGIIFGVSADTTTIVYSSAFGCKAFIVVTVNPLPLPITGITSICQGETVTLSDATPGGTWSSSSTGVALIGSGTGVTTGIAPGSAIIKYTTPEGCYSIAPFVVNPVPPGITGVAVVCEGANTTLFNALAGGLWYSADISIATMAASSGVMTGISAGITTVTYITPAGCYAVRSVTVNQTPLINSTSFTNPTTCITNDGTVSLIGLNAGQAYTVNYSAGGTPVTIVLTADGTGKIHITGLAAGTYGSFSVTTAAGCTSNVVAGPLALVLPPAPPVPTANNNAPICEGTPLNLTATDALPGVTYSWTGPLGFTSTLQNPVISPSTLAESGTYSVTATILGCVSAPATTTVVIHPIPVITNLTFTNPNTCQGTDGTITLEGLVTGVYYVVNYTYNGSPVSLTLVADASGRIVITGLAAGVYASVNVSSFTCLSNTMGPVTLSDPNPPPAPRILTNSPICTGKTLTLDAIDDVADLTYEWAGPNGFTSALKNPEREGMTMADSGLYTLIIRYRNCPTFASVNIIVYPPSVITFITPDQVIPIGASIPLTVAGALRYFWSPNDGTLDNPNIDKPVATPFQTTTYTVQAMNVWGCIDTGSVTITVDADINETVPNAFSPNDDGLNDVFRMENIKYDKLIDFSIFNRWGELVYHNTYDPKQGWDGKFKGVPQDMGIYNYSIILADPMGKTKYFKGTITLVR